MKKATQKEMNRKIKTTAMNYEMKNTDKKQYALSLLEQLNNDSCTTYSSFLADLLKAQAELSPSPNIHLPIDLTDSKSFS